MTRLRLALLAAALPSPLAAVPAVQQIDPQHLPCECKPISRAIIGLHPEVLITNINPLSAPGECIAEVLFFDDEGLHYVAPCLPLQGAHCRYFGDFVATLVVGSSVIDTELVNYDHQEPCDGDAGEKIEVTTSDLFGIPEDEVIAEMPIFCTECI